MSSPRAETGTPGVQGLSPNVTPLRPEQSRGPFGDCPFLLPAAEALEGRADFGVEGVAERGPAA